MHEQGGGGRLQPEMVGGGGESPTFGLIFATPVRSMFKYRIHGSTVPPVHPLFRRQWMNKQAYQVEKFDRIGYCETFDIN